MASFPGDKRRMERIGVHNGVLIVDDFSHHPSEAVARTGHPDVRLIEDAAEACREAALSARPGDVVVTMGAGDVWKHHGAIQEVLLRSRQ